MKTKTKLKTSHRWATELKHDRANMARLLAGVKPDGRRGRYKLFAASTIKRALAANQQRKRARRDLTDDLLLEKVRGLELRNAISDGTLVPCSKVSAIFDSHIRQLNDLIHRKLVDEWPSECAGLDVQQIRLKVRKFIDTDIASGMARMRRDIERL